MDGKKIVQDGYNAIAKAYRASRAQDQEDVALLDDLATQLPAGAKILDAGCGAGVPVARKLTCAGFEVVGVDISEAQVRLARREVPSATFICQDMVTLSFPTETFSAICSYYAIIHVPREEHAGLLYSFNRILKPGGWMLMSVGRSEWVGTDDFFGAQMYWSHYDIETNLKLIQDAGFAITWTKIIDDYLDPNATHPFIMAQKVRNVGAVSVPTLLPAPL